MPQYPLLQTKLYIPPTRSELVSRPRLIERLNAGLPRQSSSFDRKLTLISAPAGFGKTTLVNEWIQAMRRAIPTIAIGWLSLDEGDNDLVRFLSYFIAALNQIEGIEAIFGKATLSILQSPHPPPTEAVLTPLINDIATIADRILLVLDDYHLIDAETVHEAISFFIENIPPQMHLVIVTRDDPHLPLSRVRARGQLSEVRVADLRFTPPETVEFLSQVMKLDLSLEDIAALEARTEGWIAGLQLAALALQGTISVQGHTDTSNFIRAFTGSHHFVLDYLVEEVLHQQSQSLQTFLLQTSILNRLTGALCDAVTGQGNGQATLEMLDRANLFTVPLDFERRWYRYHHLFAGFLRQRLLQRVQQSTTSSAGDEKWDVAVLHRRASLWYEDHGLDVEAFQHAAAAHDVERAARLVEGAGMPLHFRGAMAPVLNWLASLPTTIMDARPSLWVTYASALTMVGEPISRVEEILQAAEVAIAEAGAPKSALAAAALQDAEPVPSAVQGPDDKTQDLVGQIAAIRAMLAIPQNQAETIIAQSRRALEFLHSDNLPARTTATWTLGFAYQLQGDRAAASRAYAEAISASQASGNTMITLAATTGLGQIQKAENQLYLAAESYRRVLELVGDPPLPAACAAYLGLANIRYEWNELDAAQQYGQQSLVLARQIQTVETPADCELILARLKLAQGDVSGAIAILARADQFVRQRGFVHRIPDVAAAQVLALLHQGDLTAAAVLAQTYELPISQARVYLARGDAGEALALLEPLCQQAEAKGWQDELLKIVVLLAVAHHLAASQADGEQAQAVQLLGDALALAAPGGFVRTFVDEGFPMAQLLTEAVTRGVMPDYAGKLLAAFEAEKQKSGDESPLPTAPALQPLIEPLSQRELEVLQLVAQGLSNREIGERLFLALDTVKGHNRRIYGKLQVSRRTEAVERARQLGLL